jgi:hypothetical protein
MRLSERTIDKKGQQLLTPEIVLEGWRTSLAVSEEDVYSSMPITAPLSSSIVNSKPISR